MGEPSRRVCALVDERDGRCCVRCGASLYAVNGSRHHRKLRSQCDRAEKHTPANLILLCGLGTTGCHGWAHAHPQAARDEGLIVHGYERPSAVPVLTKRHGWIRLDDQGGWTSDEAEEPRKAVI